MINARNTLGTTALSGRRGRIIGFALALAALLLLAHEGSAQVAEAQSDEVVEFTLLGQVVDGSSGQALSGAWVGLPGTRWGSITNDEGRFRIPDLEEGALALNIELIGYETLEWMDDVSEDSGLITIELEPQPILLEGLEVVTDRFQARRNAQATSSFAYEIDDLSISTEETALDFVSRRTAGVTPCAGVRGDTCLFVRGRLVEPVVYVDEQPLLGGLEYLNTFAPWEFHMIEIYGSGRHIRAYTPSFMKKAAQQRIVPVAFRF